MGGFHVTKSSPMRGVITMLPALMPTQTVSPSAATVRQPGLPHPVAQVEGIAAVHQQDVGLPHPEPNVPVDAGSAVSSSTPTDFQPRSDMGVIPSGDETPGCAGTAHRVPVQAVGMQSALPSSIGLPSSSTSASRMLVF